MIGLCCNFTSVLYFGYWSTILLTLAEILGALLHERAFLGLKEREDLCGVAGRHRLILPNIGSCASAAAGEGWWRDRVFGECGRLRGERRFSGFCRRRAPAA